MLLDLRSLEEAAAGGAAEITGAGQIVSLEAFGQPAISLVLVTIGITSAEAIGSPDIAVTITPNGIATAEALGNPAITVTIGATGIASAEALGLPDVAGVISSLGISSAEAFGLPDVSPVGGDITGAGGIASGEAFGNPLIDVTPLASTVQSGGSGHRPSSGRASALILPGGRVLYDYPDDAPVPEKAIAQAVRTLPELATTETNQFATAALARVVELAKYEAKQIAIAQQRLADNRRLLLMAALLDDDD